MPIKVLRYEIIKPLSIDWDTLGKILRQCRWETRLVSNKAIQLCWEWEGFSADYKEKNGVYPKAREVTGRSLFGYMYSRLRSVAETLNSANFSTSLASVEKRWKADQKQVFVGERSITSFKKDIPIALHNKSLKVVKTTDGYIARMSLLSNRGRAKFGLPSGQIEVVLTSRGNTAILKKCINGQYKIAASQIIYNKYKKKWFLNLYYTFDANEVPARDGVMGVVMGIKHVAYIAIHNSYVRGNISVGEIEQLRRQVEKRKNDLLKQQKCCGNGRIGHGTKTRIKPIEYAWDRLANAADTINHRYSRYIVNFAIKNNCGVIQMENLEGISKPDVFLKNWSYFDLQHKVEYKANEAGIKVVYIDPKFTSQRCSECGHIDTDNIDSQEEFVCIQCGYKANADFNASRNIATPNIDMIIKNALCEDSKT